MHVPILVPGHRHATGLAVTDFLVPHAQVHPGNLLLPRVRLWPGHLHPHTVFNNILFEAHWNDALLQGVSVEIYEIYITHLPFSPVLCTSRRGDV